MIFDNVLAAVAYAEEHNMRNYEIRRMEDVRKKAEEKLDALCAERNRIQAMEKISIMDKCELDVLNDNIQNAIGEHSGLIDAILIVRKRAYECWELSRLN